MVEVFGQDQCFPKVGVEITELLFSHNCKRHEVEKTKDGQTEGTETGNSIRDSDSYTHRSVEFSFAVHGHKEPTAHAQQSDHASLYCRDLQKTCGKTMTQRD